MLQTQLPAARLLLEVPHQKPFLPPSIVLSSSGLRGLVEQSVVDPVVDAGRGPVRRARVASQGHGEAVLSHRAKVHHLVSMRRMFRAFMTAVSLPKENSAENKEAKC